MRSFLFGLMCWFATEQVCQMERCYSDCLCRISITNNNPKKSAILPPFGKGRWFSQENRRDWPWYNNLICDRISYINKMFPNLSVSYADSSLYQREPCCSLGLKCRFATEQVQQREPSLCFVWVADLYRKNSLNSLKRGDQWSPLRAICDLLSSVAE